MKLSNKSKILILVMVTMMFAFFTSCDAFLDFLGIERFEGGVVRVFNHRDTPINVTVTGSNSQIFFRTIPKDSPNKLPLRIPATMPNRMLRTLMNPQRHNIAAKLFLSIFLLVKRSPRMFLIVIYICIYAVARTHS